jgi:hypothetical protein
VGVSSVGGWSGLAFYFFCGVQVDFGVSGISG